MFISNAVFISALWQPVASWWTAPSFTRFSAWGYWIVEIWIYQQYRSAVHSTDQPHLTGCWWRSTVQRKIGKDRWNPPSDPSPLTLDQKLPCFLTHIARSCKRKLRSQDKQTVFSTLSDCLHNEDVPKATNLDLSIFPLRHWVTVTDFLTTVG